MIEIKIDLSKMGRLATALTAAEVSRRSNLAMGQTLGLLKPTVQSLTPVASGGTRSRIYSRLTGSAPNLTGVVASPDAYFANIEYGRRPGARMPPEDPITRWGRYRGILEASAIFAVRRAIGRRGIKGKFVMKQAVGLSISRIRSYWTTAFSGGWV